MKKVTDHKEQANLIYNLVSVPEKLSYRISSYKINKWLIVNENKEREAAF